MSCSSKCLKLVGVSMEILEFVAMLDRGAGRVRTWDLLLTSEGWEVLWDRSLKSVKSDDANSW